MSHNIRTHRDRWLLLLGTVTLLATIAARAHAADQPSTRGRAWAYACAACHGPDGHSTGAIPALYALSAEQLRQSLQAFRSGERSGTVMNRLTQGLTDADIEAIATYFSAQRQQ